MQRFSYLRPATVAEALAAASEPGSQYLAGGTTQLDLMKDGVLAPARLVDLTRLPLATIGVEEGADAAVLRVGATATMQQLAAHPALDGLPMVREALLAGASPQLRNMATIGGNLLQRTRCRYFRDPSVGACNKRIPGSGCAAVLGHARMHAILGADEHCIALHGSDLAVALTAADAVLWITGAGGDRTVPLTEFYRPAAEDPADENVLAAGDLITAMTIPLPATGTHSGYLKVRDRASYEFALTAAAVELTIDEGTIRSARIALGGVGTVPWRARRAEAALVGAAAGPDAFRSAADAEVVDTFTVAGTAFKVELAKRTLVRQLHTVSGLPQ
jgi:CO/xanthine dehydrogenase FAD-binding subunit